MCDAVLLKTGMMVAISCCISTATCPQYAMFLPNGMVFPSSTARITGTNILYVCAIGYHITGELIATRSLVRTCRSDGQWNSSAPTCSRKFQQHHYRYMLIV